ncbi:dipeptidase [Aurantiacibacter sp. MUD11]|uniref:dipeptidase n=1 Tax=Aurantiacibacter sp. MUD11 TaxID=3003265 RepID=UPI0022AAB69D|nr:dipeptidase [Aurantiacibacter sp. MUD11]WAT17667.1 dipeptidase [Aurantiacibacter sp. MUD11]
MIRQTCLAAIAAALLAAPAAAQEAPEDVARAALEAAPVWDGHNDVPGRLRGRHGNVLADFDFNDTLEGDAWTPGEMHTDLPRLRQGKVGAQFWSVYVPAALEEPQAVVNTMEQIDVTRRLIDAYPDELALALTADDVEAAVAEGRIASLLGMEGGHSIGSSLGVLRQMYELGARYMTLTHSRNTPWADSATDAPAHGGLTEFGVLVVREMERLGMLVDLSHVSPETMHDTLDAIEAPVIFSHSGAKAVNGHARNVPDDVLARLPENGGIVMVVGLPGYLSEAQRIWYAARQAEQARLQAWWQGRPDLVEAGMAEWDEANPTPPATISDMADHVDHVREIAGIEYIGIGGDYDGMASGPVGMEDVTGYPALFTELARRGYSQADLEAIAYRNMLRVMRAAEDRAAALADMEPLESPAD